MRMKKKEFYSIEHFYKWLWNNLSYWDGLGKKVEQRSVRKYRKYIKELKKRGWIEKELKGSWSLKKNWNEILNEVNRVFSKEEKECDLDNARDFYRWLWNNASREVDGIRIVDDCVMQNYEDFTIELMRNNWIERKDENFWVLKRDYEKFCEVECAYWTAFREMRKSNTVDLENQDFIRVLRERGIIEPTWKIVIPKEYYRIMDKEFGNYMLINEAYGIERWIKEKEKELC